MYWIHVAQYRCAPHNGVSVNDGPHIRRWSINIIIYYNTVCPTRYRTRHFFNNFTTNEDMATKFEADLPHCVRNVTSKHVLEVTSCNIFIGVRIIKEIPGSVASGTPCVIL